MGKLDVYFNYLTVATFSLKIQNTFFEIISQYYRLLKQEVLMLVIVVIDCMYRFISGTFTGPVLHRFGAKVGLIICAILGSGKRTALF